MKKAATPTVKCSTCGGRCVVVERIGLRELRSLGNPLYTTRQKACPTCRPLHDDEWMRSECIKVLESWLGKTAAIPGVEAIRRIGKPSEVIEL